MPRKPLTAKVRGSVSGVGFQLLRRNGGERAIPASLWEATPHSRVEGNSSLALAIQSGSAYCAARIGNDEFELLQKWRRKSDISRVKGFLELLAIGDPYFSIVRAPSRSRANGFRPLSDEVLEKFFTLMTNSFSKVDLLGSWIRGENFFSDFFLDAKFCQRIELEPYRVSSPWTEALEGKRVLVVHPFIESIRSQYLHYRTALFPGTNILPEFHLMNYRPPQAHFGEVRSAEHWFELLDEMIEKTASMDFDVAIIGAGPFGLPLAAALKSENRVVVHLGGATQVLFGILGRRWDSDEQVSRFKNEFWVRPAQAETPGRRQQKRSPYW